MDNIFNDFKTFKLFFGYWRKFPLQLAASILFSISITSQNVILPLFIANGLSQLAKNNQVNASIIISAVAILVLSMLIGYVTNTRGEAELERRVEVAMYDDCFKYLINQDYDFFVNNFSGSLTTKANRLVRAYTNFHTTMFFDLIQQLFNVVVILGIMTYYNWVIGAVVGGLWLLSNIVIIYLVIQRVPLRRRAVSKDSQQTGELADAISNAITVKTFAGEKSEVKRYAATNRNRGDLLMSSWRMAIRNGWIIEFLCGLLQITIFVGGIYAVEHGIIDVPVFLLFQIYILRIVDSLRKMNNIVRNFEAIASDGDEMTDMLAQNPRVADPDQPEEIQLNRGSISIQDMSFDYQEAKGKQAQLFQNFNLTVKPGEKIGLVGPSGGGKTTITKLLLRFMDIKSGDILYDSQSIRAVRQAELRQRIAYVPQEPLLFHRTIAENISYGKPNASKSEIIQVAKHAKAHDFITSLPQGYDTLVGERGVKLSGGQRQRVAIARAMIKNAPILILDEATSALDSSSEKDIQAALWQLMDNRTAIVIAHRLSTIQKMDRIVVIDDGKIIEEGSHKQLLEKKGLYAQLWAHQSGGFLED